MRDVFDSEACDTSRSARRLSARKHVPNFQQAIWMMERERERAVRFSNREIEVLVDLIKTHKIVEARSVDCTTNAVKRQAWGNITAQFWTRTSSNRTEYQLLKKWKNLKHAARKYEAAINSKEQSTPGRGPPPHSPIFEEILDVIRKEQEALDSSRDNSALCFPTKVKVEPEDNYNNTEVIDNRQCPDGNTNWEQEENIHSQVDVSVHNQVHLQSTEDDMSMEPLQLVRSRNPQPDIVKRTRECEGESSDDAISVGGCSSSTQRTLAVDSSISPEIQRQLKESGSGDSPNLSLLMRRKALALKSAQLALVQKENKIKDLDILIREEQLADIIIRRKHEQELHDLRKRRMLRGLSEG